MASEHVPLDIRGMLKEAAATAFVVFALTVSLVGFEVLDVPGGIDFNTRFDDVAVAVVLAFLGRVGLVLLREGRPMPVLIGAGPLAVVLFLALLPEAIFGPDFGAAIGAYLPFRSPVIRWVLLAIICVFAVRAGLRIAHATTGAGAGESEQAMDRIGAAVQRGAIYAGPVLIVLAVAFPFLPFVNRQLIDIGILVMTYVMLGWGLNIVVGLAGLLDLGYVAFYAVGAYSYGLLATNYDLSFWICLPFAGLMAATAGVILGFPVLRLRGDYLAIVTLGFGEMVRVILINWYSVTGGPDGIRQIDQPSLFGIVDFKWFYVGDDRTSEFHQFFELPFDTVDKFVFMYYVILALALVTNLFTLRIRKLPIGRAWEALREDEIACRSLGVNPRNTKLTAFGIGAMFAGFAGSFFATRQTFISPESFTFIESAIILSIVVLGGMGSQIGVVFAAFLLIGLPEFFRDLNQYRMLAVGAAMVLIMLWRPSGLLAHREPTIRLAGATRRWPFDRRGPAEAAE